MTNLTDKVQIKPAVLLRFSGNAKMERRDA